MDLPADKMQRRERKAVYVLTGRNKKSISVSHEDGGWKLRVARPGGGPHIDETGSPLLKASVSSLRVVLSALFSRS